MLSEVTLPPQEPQPRVIDGGSAGTVLAVRRDGHVVIGGDGQVTMGNTVVKASARKIRRLGDGKILAGFAGSAADGITLFEKFESRLK